MSTKLTAGEPLPDIDVALLGGGSVRLGGDGGEWRMVIVYRGLHCPLCKAYMKRLEENKAEFEALGVSILIVSGDPVEKAATFREEVGVTVPVAYGLAEDEMRALGLYVSNPRSPEETDRPFAEPGLFVINPDGAIQIADVSNAPFARPDLAGILRGITMGKEKNYPIRGTA